MSKKQDRSSVGDVPSCSSKFVCPVSFVCLLICTAALVRVEIINQRVHHVEDVIAEVRQIHESIMKDSSEGASFQDSGRTGSVGNFDSNISKESKDMIEVHARRTRRHSSSQKRPIPDGVTIEVVRSEINKTISSWSP